MAMNLSYPPGSTTLSASELAGIIPGHINTQEQLNLWEAGNILQAEHWAARNHRDILRETYVCQLHRQMFGDTWNWAGKFRHTDKNIGAPWFEIPDRLRILLGDVRYQVEHGTWPPDELAVRFHHRLVALHPFPNGNGRHSRLMADLLVQQLGRPRFTWGSCNLEAPGQVREQYIAALQAADGHHIEALLAFARS